MANVRASTAVALAIGSFAAELRTADDKLMTTQVVVGGGLIPYKPDIVDQYFKKLARRLPRLRLTSARKTILPAYELKRALDAMWFPDNTVSESEKNSQTKWRSASLSRSRNSLAAVGAAFQRTRERTYFAGGGI